MTLKVLQSFRLKIALSGRMNMYLFRLMGYVQGVGVDYLYQASMLSKNDFRAQLS